MATRTTYKSLEFNRGELKQIDEALAGDNGIDVNDLLAAEENALSRINQFILRVCGAIKGSVIVAAYLDDTTTLDPVIVVFAEYIAAADVLAQWERYNRADEGVDGQVRRTDSDEVRGRATRIAKDIVDAGGTLTSAGAFRRWFYARGQQGMRVTGVLASGSVHDPRGYTNSWGELLPGPIDPYDIAKR